MKNTFWISTAARTGSMWLFNIVREIFIISSFNVYPNKIPKYDKDFLEIFNLKSLSDKDTNNKYVFKVHKILNQNLQNSKILTTIRDPREVCASFKEFMKSDFDSALTATKGMIDFFNYYKNFEDDYLMFFRYEDIDKNPVETILKVSNFIESEINEDVAKLISKKFSKDSIRKLIENNDKSLKKKIINKEKIDKSEIVYFSKNNYRAFDLKTGFQTNHISHRNLGEWTKVFSEKEIEIINSDSEIKVFLQENNYN